MSILSISLGDPNGVGPEILVQSLSKLNKENTYLVYGDEDVIRHAIKRFSITEQNINRVLNVRDAVPGTINVISPGIIHCSELEPGRLSRIAGKSSLEYIRLATKAVYTGEAEAVVTLPVHKEAIRMVEANFTGHTDYIAKLVGSSKKPVMLLAGERLNVSHVSTHCSLLEAIKLVKKERIEEVIELTWQTMQSFEKASKPLAVAGLNPHAGEGGAFGSEEKNEIQPAIESMKKKSIPVIGPIPPDTVFFSALKGDFSAVVCMYHDQGHIPVKTLDFEGGVNISLGLPIVRTSVDHGTAFDIAWQGKASGKSFIKAVEYAELLARRMHFNYRA